MHGRLGNILTAINIRQYALSMFYSPPCYIFVLNYAVITEYGGIVIVAVKNRALMYVNAIFRLCCDI
jgi:hypothetical protein